MFKTNSCIIRLKGRYLQMFIFLIMVDKNICIPTMKLFATNAFPRRRLHQLIHLAKHYLNGD